MSDPFDTDDMTALAARVARREVSARELLDMALARMERVNAALGAVVLDQREAALARLARGLPEGPFTGVPFLLKDLGAEAVEHPAHNGSRLLEGTVYPRESEIYRRIAATGLNVFGRTAAPEGGIGAATETAVYGAPTRNPWNPAHTPGGSSGGAGAAVAAGIVPGAHGSDGGGSVRIPASNCALFGIKPTRARLPDGPYAGEGWAGMATDGFLTRSVRDQAALLDACAGHDPGAPYTAPPLAHSFAEAAARPPGRLRIALLTRTLTGAPVHPDCAAATDAAAALCADMGHEILPIDRLAADTEAMMLAWCRIVACGTALWIDRKLAKLGRDLAPGDVEPLAASARGYARTVSGAQYLDAVECVHRYGREMADAFGAFDALISLTLAEPPARIGRFGHGAGDYLAYRMGDDGIFAYSPYCAAFNASGQPAASVPLGWSADGLPVGVHIAMAYGDDLRLMSLCAELERARPWTGHRPQIWAGSPENP